MTEQERERKEKRWEMRLNRGERVERMRNMAVRLENEGRHDMAVVCTEAANDIVGLNNQCFRLGCELNDLKGRNGRK